MVSAKNILDIARKYIGTTEANGGHKKIIDAYNNHKPLAVGYKVKYSDDWCDTFVSKVFIEAGAVVLSGTECGVDRHIQLFIQKGIWIEDGRITPRSGDIITYNWGKYTQPNDGFADHIGFVESVSGNTITTIEGNYGQAVKRRTIQVGNGQIRGYARPKYSGTTSNPTPTKTPTPVNGKTLKVGTQAVNWMDGSSIPRFVIGGTYDIIEEKAVNKPLSKKAYLIGKGKVPTGWLWEQDIDGFKAPAPQPTPKPIIRFNLTTAILSESRNKSSYNADVLTLQKALSYIYFYPDVNKNNKGCDGWFGAKTTNAVERFQLMYGLQVDGDFGPATRAKLNSLVNK